MSKSKRFAYVIRAGGILFLLLLASLLVLVARSRASDSASIRGWHVQGPGDWRDDHGEIVGTLPQRSAGSSWLVLDRGYEDFILDFSFRCSNSEAGVLLRKAPTNWTRTSHPKSSADHSSGIYFPLCGPHTGGMDLLTVDSGGQPVERTALPKPTGELDPIEVSAAGDGWTKVRITMRGDAIPAAEGAANAPVLPVDKKSHYGQLAFRVAGRPGAELRIKDFKVFDLTARTAGVPNEVIGRGFRKEQLTDLFYSEGIAAGDLNRDGSVDVVAGPFYYLGPDFKRVQEIYAPETVNPAGPGEHGNYTDSFLMYVYDFNHDGWPDVLKINFDGAFLYVNPQGELRHWDEYKVVSRLFSETTPFADIDGDGRPELIISQGGETDNRIEYAKPDSSDPTKPWTIHPISEKGGWAPHGFGVGDVNGDGRMDLVQGGGWWEQPSNPGKGPWIFHKAQFGHGPEAYLNGGADMFVYDVNGDGLADIVTSMNAHGPGLAWYEQVRDSQKSITWKQHLIMGDPSEPADARRNWEETDRSVAFTELHALGLADMDGDGLKDIVTGKRWWSHGFIPGESEMSAPPVLYWFKLVRKPGHQVEFVPHLIDNRSGVGTQISVTDVNGDGAADILTTARKGAFIFFNTLQKR